MSARPPKFRLDALLASLALIIICAISLGNVIVRYATDASFAFTEEFSVFLLVILTFAGASVAARHNQHIRIELIEHYLPPGPRKVVFVLQWLAGVVVLGLMTWYGSKFALEEYQWHSLSPGLGLPNWIYVVWLPLLSAAILVRMTQNLVDRLRGRVDPEVIHES
ncbi:TRAP transporter small permease [Marinobacter subterrani]|uniref:TRAP transporter small permease protein n=1 Tax=Marinobacter subterrani TaxID=1658765 RepID=A0A0J7JCM7_9GAMM|nr:TRAP transporter small permease [Marinobacter subterrani]KMQ75604.1 TRAP-type C4-dicarboxylate transport system, small permease component [Marinobacter subterrani]